VSSNRRNVGLGANLPCLLMLATLPNKEMMSLLITQALSMQKDCYSW